jgi:energy-coupling factor transporter transmembrane protein EcfT
MINLGHYLPGKTVVHRLDPRVKIIAVIMMSLLIFTAPAVGVILISLFLVSILTTTRMSLAQTVASVKPVAIFMMLIFLMHLFLTEGRPLLSLAPLPLRITREGLAQGAYVTWQFACLVIVAAILTMTTLPSDLVSAIERLLRPLARVGVPSQDIAVMISMALRFIPILLEEYERLRTAQTARGADFTTGSLAPRIRAVASLAVPLLLCAFRRADELALAMEARGYQRGPRTTLHELKLSGMDFAAFIVIAAFVLMNFGLRVIA